MKKIIGHDSVHKNKVKIARTMKNGFNGKAWDDRKTAIRKRVEKTIINIKKAIAKKKNAKR
jgi:hypothetical protein